MSHRHPGIDWIVPVCQDDDPQLPCRDESDVRREAVGRTRLVDQDVYPRFLGRIHSGNRQGSEDHGRGVTRQKGLQFDRIGILFPYQVLRHFSRLEVAGVRLLDRALEICIQLGQAHVRFQEADHVAGCGLDPIRFGG
jgi:hypothetical protein